MRTTICILSFFAASALAQAEPAKDAKKDTKADAKPGPTQQPGTTPSAAADGDA